MTMGSTSTRTMTMGPTNLEAYYLDAVYLKATKYYGFWADDSDESKRIKVVSKIKSMVRLVILPFLLTASRVTRRSFFWLLAALLVGRARSSKVPTT